MKVSTWPTLNFGFNANQYLRAKRRKLPFEEQFANSRHNLFVAVPRFSTSIDNCTFAWANINKVTRVNLSLTQCTPGMFALLMRGVMRKWRRVA